jgi:proline dehydrogenase
VADAVRAADSRQEHGHAATLCYWQAENEPVPAVMATVAGMVAVAADRSAWCDVALKAPALSFDPAAVKDLAQQCSLAGLNVWFDSHHPDTADATIDLAESAVAAGCSAGIAVPARWRRSTRDVARAQDAGLAVRLIKGQWPDPSWTAPSVSQSMLALVDQLADHTAAVAVASHDPRLVEAALDRRRGGARLTEIQLLEAVPSAAVLRLARQHGVPVRFYEPFGHPSLVYSLRNVWENRRTVAWFMRDAVMGRRR